ncbi:Uncharacterised protein [Mycobacteroides abscessus subsp. abscessus]|nr:Uncharacterised protein [Mycobacteroides abscessus subsp. abscessus]
MARSCTARAPSRRATAGDATITAAPPSPGEQNMNLVSGSFTISAAAIRAAGIGSRRQAFGFNAPLRYAFSATAASVAAEMPWRRMYRLIFAPKNCVVTISPSLP